MDSLLSSAVCLKYNFIIDINLTFLVGARNYVEIDIFIIDIESHIHSHVHIAQYLKACLVA